MRGNKRKIQYPVSLVLLVLFFSSCQEDDFGPTSALQVDHRLIRAWMKIPSEFEITHPPYAIEGIEITPSGVVLRLAVETATGKFVEDDDQYSDTLRAQNNLFIRKRFCPPSICIDSGTYHLQNDTLQFIYSDGYEEKYKRTRKNIVVTPPIQSELSATINTSHVTNDKIHSLPSAYVISFGSGKDTSRLQLHALLDNNYLIDIEIPQFHGTQSYPLGGSSQNSGALIYIGDDYLISYETDSLHIGTASISTFDLSTMMCSGTFEFDAARPDIPPKIFVKSIRNGEFNVPIRFPIRAKTQ
ncbi:MAG: hypothetical protein HY707_00495 [Ignavibacteriae bacterium]|nr:hypothetical protein [Ignavibacteriota bacterium]